MEIILKETIDNLGREGDIVKVKPGYARNFLLPQQKAVKVTDENLAVLENEKQEIAARIEQERKNAKKIIAQLADKVAVIHKRAGEEDRLFGSVTNGDIAAALEEMGVSIDKKAIILKEPIKKTGEFSVPVKVGFQESTSITIHVLPETVKV